METTRPAWVEIDLAALRRNVGRVRARIGDGVRLFAVVKSGGFGCGVVEVSRAVLAAGADALAVGNPEDARALRAAGIEAPVLLYAGTPPEAAGEVAGLGVIATVHDMESLRAFAALRRPLEIFMKIEVGLGRLGVEASMWEAAFAGVRDAEGLRLTGLYTHLNRPEDRDGIARQVAVFGAARDAARAVGHGDLTAMVASSHILLAYPELNYDAVNPGRCLFDLVEGPWAEMAGSEPVIAAVKSRIIQVKSFAMGAVAGFLGPEPLARETRLAVAPIGFGDGLNHKAPLGEALVRGRRVPLAGRRGIEHSVIDVTGLDAVERGDEVVLLGRQGEAVVAAAELGAWLDLPLMELLPRLARSLPRVYLDG